MTPERESLVRFAGAIDLLPAAELAALRDRSTSSDVAVRAATAKIVARVKHDGDAALVVFVHHQTLKLGHGWGVRGVSDQHVLEGVDGPR